jgi:hypothetical protein
MYIYLSQYCTEISTKKFIISVISRVLVSYLNGKAKYSVQLTRLLGKGIGCLLLCFPKLGQNPPGQNLPGQNPSYRLHRAKSHQSKIVARQNPPAKSLLESNSL